MILIESEKAGEAGFTGSALGVTTIGRRLKGVGGRRIRVVVDEVHDGFDVLSTNVGDFLQLNGKS